jgi:putative FmdB family regulatory protein
MATFPYRCPQDGPFEINRPIGTADRSVPCPQCGGDALRVFTAPLLGLADRGRMSALDRCERTRSEPDVVTSPPGRPRPGTRGAATPPAWNKLPRP